MKNATWDQMSGLTFADIPPEDLMDYAKANKAIQDSFDTDLNIRAMCPRCNELWEGTFEQVSKHVESCNEAG